ncbi:MAG: hypothetical protein WBI07_08715 [Mobilitalea sp.]
MKLYSIEEGGLNRLKYITVKVNGEEQKIFDSHNRNDGGYK